MVSFARHARWCSTVPSSFPRIVAMEDGGSVARSRNICEMNVTCMMTRFCCVPEEHKRSREEALSQSRTSRLIRVRCHSQLLLLRSNARHQVRYWIV